MTPNLEETLIKYADLIVKVGLNLQPGQRLYIGHASNRGVSLEAAPLVRQVVISAYEAGARFVHVSWGDEAVHLIRFQHAPRDSFEEYPTWEAQAALEFFEQGDAFLTITATDPDLFKDQDPELVATAQKTTYTHLAPAMALLSRNATNWCVAAAAAPRWAAKVFPDLAPHDQVSKLWDTIFKTCRLDREDPVAAWQDHVRELIAKRDYLSSRHYAALKLTAPGTDLTLGLPQIHQWRAARTTSQGGISFIPNLPTEEVFTTPHKDQAEGIVRSTMPLSYGGALIEDFSLTFASGRVVDVHAEAGETILRRLVESDEGASRLGEIALVPHSSPISQTGLLFYNTLFDENAASHLALGRGFKFAMRDGKGLSDEAYEAAAVAITASPTSTLCLALTRWRSMGSPRTAPPNRSCAAASGPLRYSCCRLERKGAAKRTTKNTKNTKDIKPD